MRKYKHGTSWCFWRWTEVDSEYITRLHIIKTALGAICLHWLKKPDPEPFPHDHPVTFLSLIWGEYHEVRNGVLRKRRWINFIKASPNDQHNIVYVKPGTVTLCIMGPKRREWGFHTPTGWVFWKDYYAKQRAAKQVTKTAINDIGEAS